MSPSELTPEEAAEAAREQLASGARRVAIVGHAGSGRSLALDALARSLDRPLRLSLLRDDDAAFAGLVDVAAQLDDAALLALISDPGASWSTKLARTVGCIEAAPPRVLLFEDPRSSGWMDTSPNLFHQRSLELTVALGNLAEVPIVYAAGLHHPASVRLQVRPASSPEAVLSLQRWTRPAMRDAAARLSEADLESLRRYSPLELRLAVACVARGVSPSKLVERRWTSAELVFEAVRAEETRRALATLSKCRVPFERSLLDRCELSPEERSLVEEAVLVRGPDDRLVVHEVVGRVAANDGWGDGAERQAHAWLAAWHRERFTQTSSARELGQAMRHEIEVVHHLTCAGDARGVLATSVYFSEQYDVLGKALSVAQRYGEAVSAYERALAHDSDDAYAHHYLAYNLDVEGREPERVQRGYVRARELDRSHPWYHSRWITFLITTGRLREAEEAWSDAEDSLSFADAPWAYKELHRNVAILLLHRGELGFGKKVLRAVPHDMRRAVDWYAPLATRLELLEEAQANRSVFPPVVSIAARWSDGPHLPRDIDDRAKIADWTPGRVTHSDEDGLRVCFARREGGVERFFYRDYDLETLARLSTQVAHGLSLPAGTFVELLVHHDGQEQLLSWQRQASSMPVPAPFPRPDRYLRRALASASA